MALVTSVNLAVPAAASRSFRNTRLPDENRGQFGLVASHNFNRTWYARTNLAWVSDHHYLEDFSNSLYGVYSYFIGSNAGIFGRGRHLEASLTAGGKVCATLSGTFVAVKPGHPAYHRWG